MPGPPECPGIRSHSRGDRRSVMEVGDLRTRPKRVEKALDEASKEFMVLG